jgi:disintegrin and metalloproteinase domain-containing protein 10
MNTVQNSAVTKDEPAIKKRDIPEGEAIDRPSGENIYGKDYTVNSRKQKREVSDNKRTCTLFLQSDIELWKYMTGKGKDQLGYSPDRAREEILSLFASHVKGIKSIYGNTMFEYDDVKYSGFSFVVRRVKVTDTSDCPDNSGDANSGNPLCAPNIDVSNFLILHSQSNHDDFCLAYIFTYRDFTGGTLGLAWVGSPTRRVGGICERWKEYTLYTLNSGRKVYMSLNTGICTLINYGQRVLPKVSTLTFAHQVGHNFGSPHDSGDVCTPFSGTTLNKQGNYIMFASATSGDRPNNSKFSPCSLGNITQVLHAVLQEQYGKKKLLRGVGGGVLWQQDRGGRRAVRLRLRRGL